MSQRCGGTRVARSHLDTHFSANVAEAKYQPASFIHSFIHAFIHQLRQINSLQLFLPQSSVETEVEAAKRRSDAPLQRPSWCSPKTAPEDPELRMWPASWCCAAPAGPSAPSCSCQAKIRQSGCPPYSRVAMLHLPECCKG